MNYLAIVRIDFRWTSPQQVEMSNKYYPIHLEETRCPLPQRGDAFRVSDNRLLRILFSLEDAALQHDSY